MVCLARGVLLEELNGDEEILFPLLVCVSAGLGVGEVDCTSLLFLPSPRALIVLAALVVIQCLTGLVL